LSQKSSESELSKSASAKSMDSKTVDAAAEVQQKAAEALRAEEKAPGKPAPETCRGVPSSVIRKRL
jgi:hypothetical protein